MVFANAEYSSSAKFQRFEAPLTPMIARTLRSLTVSEGI